MNREAGAGVLGADGLQRPTRSPTTSAWPPFLPGSADALSPELAALPSPLAAGVGSHTVCIPLCRGDPATTQPGGISGT